jgi:hypothetical protein
MDSHATLLSPTLLHLRGQLARAFRADTALPGSIGDVPSAGHCAAVAAIVHTELGGGLVSAIVDGQSHWFNRLELDGREFDVDLTGDQFGGDAVRVARKGSLYPGTRERTIRELNEETLLRASTLARRARVARAARELAGAAGRGPHQIAA